MLTNNDILHLICVPKTIETRTPAKTYRQESGHKRCDLELQANFDNTNKFEIFIRRNEKFIENYSIGLRYRTGDTNLRTITLTRYNGPHGDNSLDSDGHYAMPHIHRITARGIASGSTQPQVDHREITDRFITYEQALLAFFNDTGVTNYTDYFPELLQGRLFNGN